MISSLRTPRPVVKLMHVEYRKLKSIDSDLFAEDIRNSFVYINRPDDIEKLTLSSRLNKHALIQSRKIRSGPRTPWFDDEIMQARHNRRKAEKRWRTEKWTGLRPSSVQIQIMSNARGSYYSQFMAAQISQSYFGRAIIY